MSVSKKELDRELKKILDTYDDNARKEYEEKIKEFEKDCIDLTKETFPQFKLPIYMSISEFDNPVPNSLAYWADTEGLSDKYSNLNDNYCRDVRGNDNYVYPVRNPGTGVVSLKSCGTVVTDELKEMLDIKNELSIMIAQARNSLFRAENTSNNNSKQIMEKLNNKLKEYETLQTQYIQTLKLIKNFELLLEEKRKNVELKEENTDSLENDFNISRDIENDHNNTVRLHKNKNIKILLVIKILLFICWCLVLALFGLININKILT